MNASRFQIASPRRRLPGDEQAVPLDLGQRVRHGCDLPLRGIHSTRAASLWFLNLAPSPSAEPWAE